MRVDLPHFECLRCGHRWHPKKEEVPLCCAFCKSPYWQKAAEKPSEALERHRKDCEACKRPA